MSNNSYIVHLNQWLSWMTWHVKVLTKLKTFPWFWCTLCWKAGGAGAPAAGLPSRDSQNYYKFTCCLHRGDWQLLTGELNLWSRLSASLRLVHPVSLWPECQSSLHLSLCKHFSDSASALYVSKNVVTLTAAHSLSDLDRHAVLQILSPHLDVYAGRGWRCVCLKVRSQNTYWM